MTAINIEARLRKLEKALSLEKAQGQGIVLLYYGEDELHAEKELPPGTSFVWLDPQDREL